MTLQRKAIVIGTGAGGLVAAASLARSGFGVTALEQSDHLGGYLAPFERRGYRFDPGLHYVGRCRPGQLVHQCLLDLGLDAEQLFYEMDPAGFDIYRFPDLEVRMCRGQHAYRERLLATFPREAAGLTRFFDIGEQLATLLGRIGELSGRAPTWRDLSLLFRLPLLLRWGCRTYAGLLAATLDDPRARAVLAAACGDYGLPPSRAPAMLGTALIWHYLDGAFFPRGGSGGLRDALVQAAKRYGARFRTSARVTRILVHGTQVRGVELAGGEQVLGEVVISDVNPVITLGQLLPPAALPRCLRTRATHMEPSLSSFTVFLGLRRELQRYGLGACNIWEYPTWDIESLYAPLRAGEVPERMALFLSSNSLKDKSGSLAPPGCSTLEITTGMPYAPFRRWRGIPPDERGAEYHDLKDRIGARILAQVEARYPGLVGDVEVCEFATPLASEDYTLAVEGGSYGPAQTLNQWGVARFRTQTPVRGLLLCGAGVLAGGVAVCMHSGLMAARAARGC